VSQRLGSTEAVKQAVKAGLGVSVVIESAVEEERRAGTLLVCPLRERALAKQILVVLAKDEPKSSPARDFKDILLSESSG
jgi:DNA-binding transcriptional LysR family regulator